MKYMPKLNGIRAFAVVAVMFEHFGGEALNRFVPIGAGALGVNLFFTLSGFLITGLLLDAFTNNESKALAWRDFYVRRLLRLTPILYLAVAILALLEVRAMGSTWQWHAFYVSNFLVAAGGDKTVFWSLAVEEQFYMLWPFVIAFAPRRWLVPVCAGMFLTAVLWKLTGLLFGLYRPGVNTALFGNLEPLAVGCFLAIQSFRGGNPSAPARGGNRPLTRAGRCILRAERDEHCARELRDRCHVRPGAGGSEPSLGADDIRSLPAGAGRRVRRRSNQARPRHTRA